MAGWVIENEFKILNLLGLGKIQSSDFLMNCSKFLIGNPHNLKTT